MKQTSAALRVNIYSPLWDLAAQLGKLGGGGAERGQSVPLVVKPAAEVLTCTNPASIIGKMRSTKLSCSLLV